MRVADETSGLVDSEVMGRSTFREICPMRSVSRRFGDILARSLSAIRTVIASVAKQSRGTKCAEQFLDRRVALARFSR